MSEKPFTIMLCKVTGKEEPQFRDRESDDGIYLRCGGCGKIRGYEIGFFSDVFRSEVNKK